MNWRFITDVPREGASNMALDEALFEGVQAGGRPVLRLYRWVPACLSFGRNQPAAGIYDGAAAVAAGIDVVRRPTGGLAVYHDRELTYSVSIPVRTLGRPRATYAAINGALALGLRRLGAGAGVGTASDRAATTLETRHPCFHEAAPGEVVAAGRKLIGSAVRQEKRTLLQHGSILLEDDQSRVVRLQYGLESGVAVSADSPSIGLNQILGRTPDWQELCDHVRTAFEDSFAIRAGSDTFSESELQRAAVLEQRYRSDAWTWRR